MSYDEPKVEAEAPRIRKTPQQVMAWLLDRMRRRAAGRERIKIAERKRRIKAAKQRNVVGLTQLSVRWKPMGLVDDAEYGEALHLGCRPWVKL